AKHGIEAFARIAGTLPPHDFDRFDALYRKIRDDLGEDDQSLSVVLASVRSAPEQQASAAQPAAETAKAPVPAAAAAAAAPPSKDHFGLIVVLIVVGCAACIGIYVWSVQNEKKKKRLKKAGARTAAKLK